MKFSSFDNCVSEEFFVLVYIIGGLVIGENIFCKILEPFQICFLKIYEGFILSRYPLYLSGEGDVDGEVV